MKRVRKAALMGLVMVVLTFCGLEGLLRVFDPWGIYYYADQRAIEYTEVNGISLPVPGRYELAHSTVTILPDHSRLVPDTNPEADCTVTFIGDSVTFGAGVSDSETFVNLLAQAFPQVHVINASRRDFNSEQIALYRQQLASDGFVYLLWDNDALDRAAYHAEPARVFITYKDYLYVELYAKTWLIGADSRPFPQDMRRFWRDIEQIHDDSTLLIVNDTWDIVPELVMRYPDTAIIHWRFDTVSHTDSHPNAAGHQEAARLMLPYVREFVSEVCP